MAEHKSHSPKTKTIGIPDEKMSNSSTSESDLNSEEVLPGAFIKEQSKVLKALLNEDNVAGYPVELAEITSEKLNTLNSCANINELRKVLRPGDDLKKLSGALENMWQFRINDTYRVRFKIALDGIGFTDVKVSDFH